MGNDIDTFIQGCQNFLYTIWNKQYSITLFKVDFAIKINLMQVYNIFSNENGYQLINKYFYGYFGS